jgi:hypothetical protein
MGARLHRWACALGSSLWLAACGTTHVDFAGRAGATSDEVYASLYPYYAELCALSEVAKKPGLGAEISGGTGGHSVLYLSGVCRADAHYPTVRLCDTAVPGPDDGVGISANAHFENANWVATPGRDFFFRGDLPAHERLTRAAYRHAQAKASAMGILNGVVFHAEVFSDRPADMAERDYMYEVSVATDYAIAFGRDRYCGRIPMTRARMAKIVRFLNDRNAVYRTGGKDFEWDVLRNNCSHLTHNALAAAGVWKEWEIDRPLLVAAFDFPVPKNEFVNLIWQTNDFPSSNLATLYADPAERQALSAGDWVPTGPGGLAEFEAAIEANDLYETDLRLIFYDDPIFGDYQRRFRRILADRRYTDLAANLRYFAALYSEIDGRRVPLETYLAQHPEIGAEQRPDFTSFYTNFYDNIVRQSARVRAALTALARASP